MKPVYQTITTVPGGNCMQACIASILEIPIDEVLDVVNQDPPDQWLYRLATWLDDRGLYPAYTELTGSCNCPIVGYCILGVITDPPASKEHPEWIHAVVGIASRAKEGTYFKVVHDPNPNPRPIIQIKDALFIVRNAAPTIHVEDLP